MEAIYYGFCRTLTGRMKMTAKKTFKKGDRVRYIRPGTLCHKGAYYIVAKDTSADDGCYLVSRTPKDISQWEEWAPGDDNLASDYLVKVGPICEECDKEIPKTDIRAFRKVAIDPKAIPATCHDCAELSALNAKFSRHGSSFSR